MTTKGVTLVDVSPVDRAFDDAADQDRQDIIARTEPRHAGLTDPELALLHRLEVTQFAVVRALNWLDMGDASRAHEVLRETLK